jgi:hypothetical protein
MQVGVFWNCVKGFPLFIHLTPLKSLIRARHKVVVVTTKQRLGEFHQAVGPDAWERRQIGEKWIPFN